MRVGFEAKRIFHNSTGLGNYGRDLVRILSASQPDSSFYCYNPKPGLQLELPTNVKERTPGGIWKLLNSLWRLGPVRGMIHRDEVELFHGLSAELPGGLRIPTVVTIHDLIFMRFPGLYKSIDRKIYDRKTRHAIERADHIVSISEQTSRDLQELYGVDPTRISVIHQGCHPQFHQKPSDEDIERVRMHYKLPSEFILNVGTLEERKNSKLILQAASQLDLPVVLVGRKTDYSGELYELVRKEKMEERVTFIHDVDFKDLPAIYHMASVFCYPSRYEGFGIPIVEAMTCGVPVVTTQGGVFAEAGGDAARYIEPDDAMGLRKLLESLMVDGDEREQMINRGYEHIRAFSDHVIAGKYWSVYTKLLGS